MKRVAKRTKFAACRGLGLSLCIGLLGQSLSPPVLAQTAGATAGLNAADTAKAKQLFAEGTRAASEKRWDLARLAFQESWRLKKHWQIAINLAQAELFTGRYSDATEHLTYFLANAPSATPADQATRASAREMMEEARKQVGLLHITVSPAGAEVMLDQQALGKAPVPKDIFVAPGKRVVEASLAQYEPARASIEVAAGAEASVALKLKKVELPKPPPEKPDDVDKGFDPVKRKWGIGVGAGAAVIATAVGVGFTIKANHAAEDATTHTQNILDASHDIPPGIPFCRAGYNVEECNKLGSALVTEIDSEKAAIAGYIVGGIAAVGTLAFAYLSRPKPQTTKLQITPTGFSVREKSGGLLLSGTF